MSKLKRAKKLIGKTINWFGEPVDVLDVSFYRYPVWSDKKGKFLGVLAKEKHSWSVERVFKLSARLNIQMHMYNFAEIDQETGDFTPKAKKERWEAFNFPEKYPEEDL